MTKIYLAFILLFLSFVANANSATPSLTLDAIDRVKVTERNVWRPVEPLNRPPSFSELNHFYNSVPNAASTLGHKGAFTTKIEVVNNSNSDVWFVNLHLNYLDIGQAYWQTEQGEIISLDSFSQTNSTSLKLAHSQSFSVPIKKGQSGTLWIYIQAKIFSTTAEIAFENPSEFYYNLFLTNSITTVSYTVMLLLALIAFVIYTRTRYMVTLACSGYIGLHGLGWFIASGSLGHFITTSQFNFVYLGVMLFPFAIASASQFTKLLFNCQHEHLSLANVFNWLSIVSVIVGLLMPVLPFEFSFILAHLVAAFWIPLSIGTGVFMVNKSDFKAKYYLVGNFIYGLSLSGFVLSHFYHLNSPISVELFVQVSLTFDCICIILSLSKWLQVKQREFNRSYQVSRIDPLTQIGNRFAQNEMLASLRGHYCLTFIDLDFLKRVNDTFGHDEGDKVLIATAELIQRNAHNIGTVFRCGGDEFILVVKLESSQHAESIMLELAKLLECTEKELQNMGWKNAGISYGTATSFETTNQSECLSLADQRMYQFKKKRKSAL